MYTTIPITAETPNEPRFRTLPPWKIALVCLGVAVAGLAIMAVPGPLATRATSGPLSQPIVAGSIGFLAALSIIPAAARLLDVDRGTFFFQRPRIETLGYTGFGVVVGFALLASASLVGSVSVTLADLSLRAVFGHLLAAILVGLWTGTIEEFLVRGVFLSLLGHRWHWPGAIGATSLLFGLLHHGAAAGTTASMLYITVTTLAGVLFALVTVVTGNIWNAVALHATWNGLFNAYVVGLEPPGEITPIFTIEVRGANRLLSAGGASLTESPLAVALFASALLGYGVWTARDSYSNERHQS